MSALVEAGLRRILDERSRSDGDLSSLPTLPSWRGGRELVDVSSRSELYRVMEED